MTPHVHGTPASAHRRRLVAVFGVTATVFLIELVGALLANSLALLADAGHMFTDVAGIGLALLAIWFSGRPPTQARTFGFLRLEILAAVVNAVVLLGVAVLILVEALRRLAEPTAVAPGIMLAVALLGLAANGLSLAVLHGPQRDSLNMRGAYLEVLGDFGGSAAVIVAAVVISLTGWAQADAVASLVIGGLIVPRTWGLIRDAVDVLLEATPKGVRLDDVRVHILQAPGVADVHDLHAWSITSGVNVVSAHVVLVESADPPTVLDYLCECLSGDFDIEHSTFQLETWDRRRLEERGHA